MPSFAARFALCMMAAVAVVAPASAQQAPFDSVQVRLLKSALPRTVIVSGSEGLRLYSSNGPAPIATLSPGQKLAITTSGSRLYLKPGEAGGGIYAVVLTIKQPAGGALTIELVEAQSKPNRDHIYRGQLRMEIDPTRASTLKMVNRVAIEDYVESVLASEFSFEDLESSKAMATCIRTLSWRSLLQHGPEYELPDHDIWQVYHGISPITRTAREATRATRGYVLTYAGDLIESVYHSSSGGHTANHEEVWDAELVLPYLRGKRDPFDDTSPYSAWSIDLPKKELLQALSEDNNLRVTGFRVKDTGSDRRVREIVLLSEGGTSTAIRSNAFRLTVNRRFGKDKLRSTLFELDANESSYLFKGKGYGHGVGLSQYGALEMARQGKRFDEILAYYFEGATVERPLSSDDLVAAGDDAIVPTATDLGFREPAAREGPSRGAREAPRAEPVRRSSSTRSRRTSTTRRRIGW
jgi:stage II sporulation protein D